MNQQEATRAGTFSGLRAGSTVKEIMSYGDFSKKTYFPMINGSSTNVLLVDDLLIQLWQQDKWLWGNSPGGQPGGAHHQGHQQVNEVPFARHEHLHNNLGKMLSEDRPDSWKSPLHLPAWTALLATTARGRRICSRRTSQRCVRRRSGLPAPLTATLWTSLCGASMN